MDVVPLLLSLAAVIQDLRTAKIKNWLIAMGMLIAVLQKLLFDFVHMSFYEKMISIGLFIGNLSILFVILFALYYVRALGAGDCKLLLMIGMYLPIEKSIVILICALVVAAVYGTVRNIMRKYFWKKETFSGIHFSVPVMVVEAAVVLWNFLYKACS